jgi:hypothetical protein
MTNHRSIHTALSVALLFGAVSLTGCPDDPPPPEGDTETSTTDPPQTDTSVGPTTNPPDTSSSDEAETTVSPSSTDGVDTMETETSGDEFEFSEEPYDAYTQIDRHAAVEAGTAGILASAGLGLGGEDLSVRDDYNASNPAEDAAMMWVPEIADSVMFFHASFDDDLVSLMLTPASFDESIMQAGPVIIPDTIKYDPNMPTSYPNGRNLEDQVVDITLAAVLIDLGTHPLDLFASLPLNPAQNDVPFEEEFPYLAPPHAP